MYALGLFTHYWPLLAAAAVLGVMLAVMRQAKRRAHIHKPMSEQRKIELLNGYTKGLDREFE